MDAELPVMMYIPGKNYFLPQAKLLFKFYGFRITTNIRKQEILCFSNAAIIFWIKQNINLLYIKNRKKDSKVFST